MADFVDGRAEDAGSEEEEVPKQRGKGKAGADGKPKLREEEPDASGSDDDSSEEGEEVRGPAGQGVRSRGRPGSSHRPAGDETHVC